MCTQDCADASDHHHAILVYFLVRLRPQALLKVKVKGQKYVQVVRGYAQLMLIYIYAISYYWTGQSKQWVECQGQKLVQVLRAGVMPSLY